MAEPRLGRQIPTQSVALPYSETRGPEAVELYNSTGRTAQEWQELMLADILAVNEDGLWVHTRFGYSVPRRNGKNEIVAIRELFGITNGEHILHTAHRTTTSSSASRRLAALLDSAGYTEVIRYKKGEIYDKHYTYAKQLGLERITILGENGGRCDFRTRSAKGGLGEGFDLLVIDEAQEYQDDQESALKYVVTDSANPQTIFCGTPPTPVSSGTVFTKFREATLSGEKANSGWAEWSVDTQSDPTDRELWYLTNPSLGTIFTERSVADEIGTDPVDFNIQRLGLWIKYSLKSEISEAEWNELKVDILPELRGKLFVGIKYGQDGANVAMSIAVKAEKGKIFVETIDCQSTRTGSGWILRFLKAADVDKVVIDGTGGQTLLADDMKAAKLKAPILPTVKEVVIANATFKQGLELKTLCHAGQPSLVQVVSNCEKRSIGSSGGFGYRALKEEHEIALMDSMILAHWACYTSKDRRKQRVSY